MTVNAVKEFVMLFNDARDPADKFYEAYRPLERISVHPNAMKGMNKKQMELEDHLNQDNPADADYINIQVGDEQEGKSEDEESGSYEDSETQKDGEKENDEDKEAQSGEEEEKEGKEETTLNKQATENSESKASKKSKGSGKKVK